MGGGSSSEQVSTGREIPNVQLVGEWSQSQVSMRQGRREGVSCGLSCADPHEETDRTENITGFVSLMSAL